MPTTTKNKPYYQPTISSQYNATWHTREMLSIGGHIFTTIKKRCIGGFANLVHVGGTEKNMCYAHSLRGKIDNYHHPLGDWKE